MQKWLFLHQVGSPAGTVSWLQLDYMFIRCSRQQGYLAPTSSIPVSFAPSLVPQSAQTQTQGTHCLLYISCRSHSRCRWLPGH